MSLAKAKSGTLVHRLAEMLRGEIARGVYEPGSRLPSETQLCSDHGVSRTVVREAIAALKGDGLVEPRQGAGIFVAKPTASHDLPFQDVDYARVSSIIEMLELRTAVEVEAAGLAALRGSPSQEERIVECLHDIRACAARGEPTTEADFALHLAIADATNNPRFREFLSMLGSNLIPRRALQTGESERVSASYLSVLDAEHEEIVAAIVNGQEREARDAMRKHLEGSRTRYRSLLRKSTPASARQSAAKPS